MPVTLLVLHFLSEYKRMSLSSAIFRRFTSFNFSVTAYKLFQVLHHIHDYPVFQMVFPRQYKCTLPAYLLIIRVILTFKDNRFPLITLDFALFYEFFFFCSDTFKENACRFIIRVLRYKFSSDCKVEDFGFGGLDCACRDLIFLFQENQYIQNIR